MYRDTLITSCRGVRVGTLGYARGTILWYKWGYHIILEHMMHIKVLCTLHAYRVQGVQSETLGYIENIKVRTVNAMFRSN